MKDSHNYSYAVDAEKKLIHVSAALRNTDYFCLYCGAPMIPHMGKVRRWHFTHKTNIENCSYETYLHKISKVKIREAFLCSPHFNISFDVPVYCNKTDCINRRREFCVDHQRKDFDLKKYYDACEEEVLYKKFRADLLLTSSTHPNREPILLEICVSHKSTEEKIQDGARIIEIHISSEKDIDKIISSLRIEGVSDSSCDFSQKKSRAIFYNFKAQCYVTPSYFNKILPYFTYYMWLNPAGKFKVGKCLCDKDPMKYIPDDAHYIISDEYISFDWGFSEFAKRGVFATNCLVCKYSNLTMNNERICTLYRKFGTPRQPAIDSAKDCQYFRRLLFEDSSEMQIDFQYKIVIRT